MDEQDLIQHTKSPLAVGLFEHRDSLSLAESSLSHKGKNDYVGDVISELFLKPNLWDGKVNPLFCADTMGGIKYLEKHITINRSEKGNNTNEETFSKKSTPNIGIKSLTSLLLNISFKKNFENFK